MRDIRADLRDRLNQLDAEKSKVNTRLEEMEQQRQILISLIREEEARFGPLDQQPLIPQKSEQANGDQTPLARLILGLLADQEPHVLTHLVQGALAKNYPFGEKSPARSINWALFGMMNRKMVERSGKAWKLANRDIGML